VRSRREIVTFNHSFGFAGLDGQQPAGRYEVMTDEAEIPDLSFIAWRRVATSMRFPSLGAATNIEQWTSINPEDLATALERDRLPTD
jgi:hypothetical protein